MVWRRFKFAEESADCSLFEEESIVHLRANFGESVQQDERLHREEFLLRKRCQHPEKRKLVPAILLFESDNGRNWEAAKCRGVNCIYWLSWCRKRRRRRVVIQYDCCSYAGRDDYMQNVWHQNEQIFFSSRNRHDIRKDNKIVSSRILR